MLWLCIGLPWLAREIPASGPAAGRAALERLAAWGYQWSSQIHYREADRDATPDRGASAALWLEIEASAKLFGGHASLLQQITSELAALGYSHEIGVAPSVEGAALLARAAAPAGVNAAHADIDAAHTHINPVANVALDRHALRQRLAPLPLRWLAWPTDVIHGLRSAGLSCIGELLALAPAALARRFGPQASLYLRRLCAEAPDPRTAWRLPATYCTRCEFDTPIHDMTALLFPLQRLLSEFQGYLRAVDRGVQRFTLQLEHPRRGAAGRRTATALTIGVSQPARDAAQFTALIRERLAATALTAPVTALGLTASEFTASPVIETDFFGTQTQRLQQLQQVLDRLRAKLGADRIQTLQIRADHRPEGAWHTVTGCTATTAGTAPLPAATDAPRPCWLLREPQRIDTPLQVLGGPERIESGWWDGRDCARDYYLARTPAGARWWVFRNLRDGDWYLQGLWA